jgi:hypothetical protein
MYKILIAWLIFFVTFGLAKYNLQPIVTQKGALAQFDDSYVGFVLNQNAADLVRNTAFIVAVILLLLTFKIILKEKKKL